MTVLGIDLGTSNSCVAVFENGSPKVLVNLEGSRTTPSVVAFTESETLVGDPAKRQQVTNPKNTISSAKRFIGLPFDLAKSEMDRAPYKIEKNGEGVHFIVNGVKVTPEEVGSKILGKLKVAAEKYLGNTVTQAVITVPAYFDNAQRQATKDAGTIAGLEVLRVINEPTAAALAYGFDKKNEGKILVIDCGGGTTDISILDIEDEIVEVISTNGDTHLGGDDFDNVLIDFLAEDFKNKEGIDLRDDSLSLQRLKTEAERIKVELSSVAEVDVNLPYVTADANGPKHLACKVSRTKFETLIEPLVQKIFKCSDLALKDAKLTESDIDEIIFVGGSTRIPLISDRTIAKFNKEPNHSVNPDEIVALGAACQGAILSGEESGLLLVDVTPLSLGLETMGGIMTTIIERNTTIPAKKTQVFSTAVDNQPSVTVRVAQGERKMFSDNKELATFNLDGLPVAPRGIPQIEVTFDIDANGIVNVSAKDLATNKDKGIQIKSGLDKDDIERMVKEAEDNADDDDRRLKSVEGLNKLEQLIFTTEKTITDNEGSISKETLGEVEAVLETAKKALGDRDDNAVESISKALLDISSKVAQEMYDSKKVDEEVPADNSVDANEANVVDEGNVVDADFEEVNDE